jgi:hypothetical protein
VGLAAGAIVVSPAPFPRLFPLFVRCVSLHSSSNKFYDNSLVVPLKKGNIYLRVSKKFYLHRILHTPEEDWFSMCSNRKRNERRLDRVRSQERKVTQKQ